MTTPKLPEPVARLMTWHGPRDVPSPKITARSFSEYSKWDRVEKRYWHDGELLYTADQVREILEIAAKESDNLAPDPDQWSPKEEYTERRTARACAAAIRVLKEQL